MKHLFTSLSAFLFLHVSYGQCSFVTVAVSSSDTSLVQLYHPGLFLIPNGDANICDWTVTTMDGTLVHEATTSGDFEGQSFMLFTHNVPVTDSMQVTLVITNDVEGITCTVVDTLVWEETEPVPGFPFGDWVVVGENGGVVTSVQVLMAHGDHMLAVFPNPAADRIWINGAGANFTASIVDENGALIASHLLSSTSEGLDIAILAPGTYFVQVQDDRGRSVGLARFQKR